MPTIHRPDPMQDDLLGPWLQCLNDEARKAILGNIARRQNASARAIEALLPVLEELQAAGVDLTEEGNEGGIIGHAQELLNEIDSMVNEQDTEVSALMDRLIGHNDSDIQDRFFCFSFEMLKAFDRFRMAKQPA